ncbi:uncharacterized protein [Aegilops tauschii subsp. strangulata]|uniref:uncharacterized protein n=1 Tax=Aegilops tauschii subsp. strangulata TaxID=200361 RepID=UPI003CC86513
MRGRWPLPPDEVLINSGKELLLNLLANCSDDVRDMVIILIWRIWHLRSDASHGKEIPPVLVTVEFLDSYYKSVKLAGRFSTEEIIKGKMNASDHAPKLKTIQASAPWPAPRRGTVALSVDGSFQESDGTAAAGMVLRDETGKVLFAAYHYIFNCNDALEAEVHALMQGMALAIPHSTLPVVVQSDSATALSSLSSNCLNRSAYGQLVLEIKELMGDREFLPQKILRSQNSVADRLAKYSRSERTTAVWV